MLVLAHTRQVTETESEIASQIEAIRDAVPALGLGVTEVSNHIFGLAELCKRNLSPQSAAEHFYKRRVP